MLTVGSDCNVGKMSTSLELDLLARKRGLKSTFVATGQTGIMIANSGIAVDRVISDFVNGAIEEIVVPAAETVRLGLGRGAGHRCSTPATRA